MTGDLVKSQQTRVRLGGLHVVPGLGLLTLAVGLVVALSGPAAASRTAPATSPVLTASHLLARIPPEPVVLTGRSAARLLAGAAGLLGPLAAADPSANAASSGDPWQVQPTPNPAMPNGVLYADSCTSSSACTAVGDYENTAGTELTLAERWNGATWRIQATPDLPGAVWTELSSVSCTSAHACAAAGYYVNRSGLILTLAEQWNGTRWAVRTTPNPRASRGSALFAISCRSASACTAVGAAVSSTGQMVTLAERWAGRRWVIEPTINPAGADASQLLAVSCSAAGACTAVGSSVTSTGVQVTLAERWNGVSWTSQQSAVPAGAVTAGLSGISCPAANLCTAVGQYADASFPGRTMVLAEAWNGTSWQIQPAPSPAPPQQEATSGSGLTAVSCASPSLCTAAGYYTAVTGTKALAERWNGTSWSIQPTPSPARSRGGGLAAVSCPSPTDCVAAGSYQVVIPAVTFGGLPTPGRTLAESWTGKNWRIQATANSSGADVDSVLSAASCASPRACTAVGDYTNSAGNSVALAEAWNGTRWRIQFTPAPANSSFPDFDGVSCTSARACTAVGSYISSELTSFALAERWDGTRWVIQPTPRLSNGAFYGVSCTSARACTAVGSVAKSGILVETWNGARWHIQPAPTPAGGTGGLLAGISCSSARACMAVGSYLTSAGKRLTLAETWNGHRWRTQPTQSPKSAASAQLSDVSCASARACMAIGSSTITIKEGKLTVTEFRPLTETWNGEHWRIQSVPSLRGAVSTALRAVSCTSARACTASAGETNNAGGETAVVANWNGTRWTAQAAVIPVGSVGSGLNGVSCAGRDCTAVGWYAGQSGISLTLAITKGRTT
jgi:hypothetical protein